MLTNKAVLWEREPGDWNWFIVGEVKIIAESEEAIKIKRKFKKKWIPKSGFFKIDVIKNSVA